MMASHRSSSFASGPGGPPNHLDAGEKRAVAFVRHCRHVDLCAEMAQRDAEGDQCRTAAHDQLAVVWVHDGKATRVVGVKLDRVSVQVEQPGLTVVTARRQ